MKKNLIYSTIGMLLFFLGTTTASAQTIIPGGTINEPQVRWTLDNSPYLIEGDLLLAEGSLLIIDSNAVVEFQGNYGLTVNGALRASGVIFRGKDLGSGKHVLWNGIKVASYEGTITFYAVEVHDSKIGIDLIDVPYQTDPAIKNSFIYCFLTTFNNNQIGIRMASTGADIALNSSSFTNNDIGILGGLEPNSTLQEVKIIGIGGVIFEGNRIAIYEGYYMINVCFFTNNDSAVYNVVATQVDSCLFDRNGLGVSGHSLSIESSGFTNNGQAVFLTPHDQTKDSIIANTIINTSHFENNDTAISMAENHNIASIECNLFIKNAMALSIYNQTSTLDGQAFAIERNTFNSNSKAILVNHQNQNLPLYPGASYQLPSMYYNSFRNNPQLFTNHSTEALNLFKNYMEGDKQMLEFGIVDGSDSAFLGLVNYTISGDTNRVGSFFVVTKIEDVIKHANYDSTDVAGTDFTIISCTPKPGNPLSTDKLEENEFVAFPNPVQSSLNIRWTDGQEYRMYLFNALGQAIALPNNQALTSPAELRLEGLPEGIYLLLLKNESGSKTLKVVKE